MKKTRLEHDVLGYVEVEADKYWKSQTQRSLQNFNIGKELMPESIIKSFAILKEACALTNKQFDLITDEQCKAIVDVC